MTPLSIPLARDDGLGKGNFIFINPKAENPAPPSGLYGVGSLIAKAADSGDLNLTLIQKEYDEVKNSTNLAALHAFDATYKGKPFGQTLVNLIEERISLLERPPGGAKSVVAPTAPQAKPKDFKSDVVYLSSLAKEKRLLEVRGEYRGSTDELDYSDSTFVITGAERCDVNINKKTKAPYVGCYFPTGRFSFQNLLLELKSALPDLSWGKETTSEKRLADVDGYAASLWVNITRFAVATESVRIYFYEYPLP